MIVTNATFIIPSIKSVFLHKWTRAVVYFIMIFASSFYHSCKSFPGTCVFPPIIGRKMDFFFAQELIILTALYLIIFPARYAFIERWLIWGSMVALFVVEVFTNEPFAVQLIIAGVSFIAIVGYWIAYARFEYLTTGRAKLPDYDWTALTMGIALTALACTLFATQKNWHNGYDWVHAVWHASAALGQYFILCCRDSGNRMAALDKKVEKRYEAFAAMIRGSG